MSTNPKKKRSPFAQPINPEVAAGKKRNKRTSYEPAFSAGGSWRNLVGADPASERYSREKGTWNDIEGLVETDPSHRIFEDPAANNDLRVIRRVLMASLSREGQRIDQTVKFENILLATISKMNTVIRRYEGRIDPQLSEEVKAILTQAESDASEV